MYVLGPDGSPVPDLSPAPGHGSDATPRLVHASSLRLERRLVKGGVLATLAAASAERFRRRGALALGDALTILSAPAEEEAEGGAFGGRYGASMAFAGERAAATAHARVCSAAEEQKKMPSLLLRSDAAALQKEKVALVFLATLEAIDPLDPKPPPSPPPPPPPVASHGSPLHDAWRSAWRAEDEGGGAASGAPGVGSDDGDTDGASDGDTDLDRLVKDFSCAACRDTIAAKAKGASYGAVASLGERGLVRCGVSRLAAKKMHRKAADLAKVAAAIVDEFTAASKEDRLVEGPPGAEESAREPIGESVEAAVVAARPAPLREAAGGRGTGPVSLTVLLNTLSDTEAWGEGPSREGRRWWPADESAEEGAELVASSGSGEREVVSMHVDRDMPISWVGGIAWPILCVWGGQTESEPQR